ncbi:MAG: flippase-like domain-containing protein [Gemmataceae bacterium]|nr:flippase-like domain-containing protein [Gemmataceae bacterium]
MRTTDRGRPYNGRMAPATRKRLWLAVKTVLAAVIVVGVARLFARILTAPELNPYPFALRVEYLVPAGLLYLLAHTCWAGFWVRLLHSQGIRVRFLAGLRAYFVSQFGKYVPGKALVILWRVRLLRGTPGARPLAVGVTATYETLTSMAAGALIGVALLQDLGVLPPEVGGNVGLLLAVGGLPVVLGVVNKLAARRSNRLRGPDAPPLPSPPVGLLVQGLLHGAVGWCLLALSLALTVRAVAPEPPGWGWDAFRTDLGAVSIAYVVGFVVLVAPGGLGPREYLLQVLLTPRFAAGPTPELAAAQATVVALVLRLTWLIPELLVSVGLYLWRPPPAEPLP